MLMLDMTSNKHAEINYHHHHHHHDHHQEHQILLPLRLESSFEQWWFVAPIDWAAANGHTEVVKELLKMDPSLFHNLTSKRRIRRLEKLWDDQNTFSGAAIGRLKVIRDLLREFQDGHYSSYGSCNRGCSGNYVPVPYKHCHQLAHIISELFEHGTYDAWLVYIASAAGDEALVNHVLTANQDLLIGESDFGLSDLLYAAARGKNIRVFHKILTSAKSRKSSYTETSLDLCNRAVQNKALLAAAKAGNVEMLKELIRDSSFADANALDCLKDRKGLTALHAAAGRGHLQVVRFILDICPESIHGQDEKGSTALHTAARRGCVEVAKEIMKFSKDIIYSRNKKGETPLHSAIMGTKQVPPKSIMKQGGRMEMVRQLLACNAGSVPGYVNWKTRQGQSPLHLAVATVKVDENLVALLLETPGILVNECDSEGRTALDLAEAYHRLYPAAEFRYNMVISLLVSHKASHGNRTSGVLPVDNPASVKLASTNVDLADPVMCSFSSHDTGPSFDLNGPRLEVSAKYINGSATPMLGLRTGRSVATEHSASINGMKNNCGIKPQLYKLPELIPVKATEKHVSSDKPHELHKLPEIHAEASRVSASSTGLELHKLPNLTEIESTRVQLDTSSTSKCNNSKRSNTGRAGATCAEPPIQCFSIEYLQSLLANPQVDSRNHKCWHGSGRQTHHIWSWIGRQLFQLQSKTVCNHVKLNRLNVCNVNQDDAISIPDGTVNAMSTPGHPLAAEKTLRQKFINCTDNVLFHDSPHDQCAENSSDKSNQKCHKLTKSGEESDLTSYSCFDQYDTSSSPIFSTAPASPAFMRSRLKSFLDDQASVTADQLTASPSSDVPGEANATLDHDEPKRSKKSKLKWIKNQKLAMAMVTNLIKEKIWLLHHETNRVHKSDVSKIFHSQQHRDQLSIEEDEFISISCRRTSIILNEHEVYDTEVPQVATQCERNISRSWCDILNARSQCFTCVETGNDERIKVDEKLEGDILRWPNEEHLIYMHDPKQSIHKSISSRLVMNRGAASTVQNISNTVELVQEHNVNIRSDHVYHDEVIPSNNVNGQCSSLSYARSSCGSSPSSTPRPSVSLSLSPWLSPTLRAARKRDASMPTRNSLDENVVSSQVITHHPQRDSVQDSPNDHKARHISLNLCCGLVLHGEQQCLNEHVGKSQGDKI